MKANTRLRQARVARNWRQSDLAEHLGTTAITIRRWERGSNQPSAYYRMKLCALFGISAEELGLLEEKPVLSTPKEERVGVVQINGSSTDMPALWTVPYQRNPHFTGRDEILDQLDQFFSIEGPVTSTTTRSVALTQPQAIKGLGGIGKTQLVIEYAYRARSQGRYTHTLWVNAGSEEAIMTSLVELAELLPVFPAKSETDQHKLVAAIKRWLEQCQQRWLLIFDNADDLSLIQEYVPLQDNGSLLLTTRAHAVAAIATSIEVEAMGLMEGTQLLLHRAQRLQVTDEERNEAANIVISLDGFPLALDQAGAYIEETACSFEEYLRIYRDHRKALLARRGLQATNYPDSVATTWSLSFQRVERTSPAAADLLRLCAFLAPDHIPEELLRDGAAHWPPALQQATADRFVFNHALEAILRFSLIKRRVENHTFSIHRLVQAVQIERMESEEQCQWAERVVRAVNVVFPPHPQEEIASWPQCLRYLEQAQACDTLIQQHLLTLPEGADLLDRAGTYLREHASYTIAESLYRRALHIREQRFGPEHPQIASSLNGLAILYREQGKYAEAELLYQQTLRIQEQHLGPGHLDVTSPLNGLALLYREQGRYAEAELLYQRALHIREQHLGPEHPDVTTPMNNLAHIYTEQGKYAEAELLYRRVLCIREQHLGPEHLLVGSTLNGIANIYLDLGRYAEAKPLYQQTLRIWEQHLGFEHSRLAFPLHNLALLYFVQGQYEQAEPLYQRALRLLESSEHPLMASLLSGLAHLYLEQGRYAEAEPLYQRALAIREQQPGPDLALPLVGLANLYLAQARYAEAEPLYQRALAIREQLFVSEHPQVADPLNGLANLYREQGKYVEAERLFQRVLSIREHALDSYHPDIAETLYDFALLQEAQGNIQEATSFHQRALSIREQIFGLRHPKTTEIRKRLRAVLIVLGRAEDVAQLDAAQQEPTETEREQETPPEP